MANVTFTSRFGFCECCTTRVSCYELAAPQGFEPRYADPESAVLPLNEGAAVRLEPNDAANPILLGVTGGGQCAGVGPATRVRDVIPLPLRAAG